MSLITRNAKEYRSMTAHCQLMSQNLLIVSGPFGIFLFYVILTISYLRAQTIETSSLPTDFWRPLFKQIEIFSILNCKYFPVSTFNCKYFPQYTRELLECLLGISPSGRNPCGGNYMPVAKVFTLLPTELKKKLCYCIIQESCVQ